MDISERKTFFEGRIAAACRDEAALTEIEAELAGLRGVLWANPLRMRVIKLRRDLLNGVAVSRSARFNLPDRISGQPLYAYRLTGDQFIELERLLKRRAVTGHLRAPIDQGAFVLWAGEWFRRCFTGGLQRWSDLGARIGLNQTQAEWRAIADGGLGYWGFRPLRLNGMTRRLLHLARQGGFPTAAIESPDGWVAKYLENLVGVLLDIEVVTADIAFDFAEGLQHILPASWRYQDFYLVSADLAHAIVRLRQEAQAGGLASGLPASVWLDQHRSGWRSELPLVIDSDTGRKLIDGLMKVEQIRGGGGTIGVDRVLVRIAGSWQASLSLRLNGEMRSPELSSFASDWGRLRMFAAGQMAGHIPGELAMLEPADNGNWLARATKGSALLPLPLSVSADVELRGGGERVGSVSTLNNGEAVRSPLLVMQPRGDEELSEPRELKVVGTGSGGYRADPLYLLAPTTWLVEPVGDAAQVESIEFSEDGRRLWKISGVVTAKTDQSDVYLIRAGQSREEKDRLIIAGQRLASAQGADGQEVFLDVPTFFVVEDKRERSPGAGELWWRPFGDTSWRANGVGRPLGLCEFAWRSSSTGHIRDRASVIVLPASFRLQLPTQAGSPELLISGWPGQCIFNGEAGEGASHRWQMGVANGLPTFAAIVLRSEAIPPFQLQVKLPRRPGIGTWDGQPANHRDVLVLSNLHRYLAVAEGRQHLLARLRDNRGAYLEQGQRSWNFDDELPLTAVHDDLAAMLRPLGDLDATIEISISGSAGHWYVGEFDARLKVDGALLVPSKALSVKDAIIVARPLHDPASEHDLGEIDLEGGPGTIPLQLLPPLGCWLVYLKAGQAVVTRPYLHVGAALEMAPGSTLGEVMAIDDHATRQIAVKSLCDQAESGSQGDAALGELLALVESLGALPPATFDVLAEAFKRPLLATRLLYRANQTQLPLVLSLQDALPFAWTCIPKRWWDEAGRLHFEAILSGLPETLANDLSLPASAIGAVRKWIKEWEPELSPLIELAPPTPPLRDIAQSFVQRAHDRTLGFGASPFRPTMAKYLPQWPFDDEFFRALDAPCAAALAARGKITVTDLQLRCIKDVARRHPRYFLEAFSAFFKELPSV